MSVPARHPFPHLIFSGSHVVQTLPGISTDINHILGDVDFDGFPSIRSSSRYVECALNGLRASPTDHNRIERVDNVLMAFSAHLSTENAAHIHPNIAPVAVVNAMRTTESKPFIFTGILSPWYSGGGILEHVNTYPGVDKTTLLIDIGKALKHLHSHDVVHGAIHPSNILIDNDGHAIVTDAGVRILISQIISIPFGRLPLVLSAIYQPSEQLCPVTDTLVQPTTCMDVYSFATTAWTIFTGKKPFGGLPNFRTIAQIVVEIGLCGHQHLVKPSNMSDTLWVILQKCLAMDPALRPTMMEVLAELEDLSL